VIVEWPSNETRQKERNKHSGCTVEEVDSPVISTQSESNGAALKLRPDVKHHAAQDRRVGEGSWNRSPGCCGRRRNTPPSNTSSTIILVLTSSSTVALARSRTRMMST